MGSVKPSNPDTAIRSRLKLQTHSPLTDAAAHQLLQAYEFLEFFTKNWKLQSDDGTRPANSDPLSADWLRLAYLW